MGKSTSSVMKSRSPLNGSPNPRTSMADLEKIIQDIESILNGRPGEVRQDIRSVDNLRRLRTRIDSMLEAGPFRVDEHREGESLMDQIKRQTVGRIYALVGRAEVDMAGQLSFAMEPQVTLDQCESVTKRLAADVNEGRSIPGYSTDHACTGAGFDPERLHAIEEALSIDSEGALIFVEDAEFAATLFKSAASR